MAKVDLAIFTVTMLSLLTFALCDMYLQNPRGSNDRLNEANTNRNNGNRLFDSQNNAKGGYCVGPQMSFYEGSMLSVEWTNQHGCGSNPKLVCNIVIQYMCGTTDDEPLELIRDGTTTNTIPADATGAADLQFGMHESLQNYLNCNTRERNQGLYIADREQQGGLNANRATAIYTRQNNNGNRNGLECAEERDYYPYWHPAPWKDVAILVSQKKFCDFYQSNSQNVKAKNYCGDKTALGVHEAPNNQKDCEDNGLDWINQDSWGMEAPDCQEVPWSRENQLGNGANGHANMYNWTLPKGVESCVNDDNCICVLRVRYNISTEEEGFPDMNRPDTGFVDSALNGKDSVQLQNPTVVVADALTEEGAQTEVEIAADTSQFGRTFQDRSHIWGLKKRPSGISSSARIYNLNVKGKRGNIVQTYPATEYDFIPQYLYIRLGDYIHFQWTGCDTNPAGNAGEGTAQTDRSNIVQMINAHASTPATDSWLKANPKKVLFQDPKLRLRFALIGQQDCEDYADILAQNNNNAGNADADVDNCAKLNKAEPYFDGGLVKMNLTGTFHYMSTRNHNFSNRDQKGIVYVVPLLPPWAIALVIVGAIICLGAFGVAGAMIYAKSYPHSGVANLFSKM